MPETTAEILSVPVRCQIDCGFVIDPAIQEGFGIYQKMKFNPAFEICCRTMAWTRFNFVCWKKVHGTNRIWRIFQNLYYSEDVNAHENHSGPGIMKMAS